MTKHIHRYKKTRTEIKLTETSVPATAGQASSCTCRHHGHVSVRARGTLHHLPWSCQTVYVGLEGGEG